MPRTCRKLGKDEDPSNEGHDEGDGEEEEALE